MEEKKFRKKGGRPRLPAQERRQNVTLMLTPLEVEQLRKEHAGYVVDFGVFLREKLLDREAVTLSKPIDPEVRAEMTNLLKMTGSMLLIAKRTEYDVLVSKEFSEMAVELRMAIQKANYNINELVLSKSLIPNLIRHVKDLKKSVMDLQKESTNIEVILYLLSCVSQIEERMKVFAGQYGISED
ncbi:hypothetical protein DYBT9623_05226 [Dyadobacter sp. CECT 9623]|uniref:Uncharacterized protein n=2 Tax=Dyadobacter linearis TaxID=2823330 RepID=A0ABM8UY46_9BACT|nr:hypothetical protein DYBT9623_05226 [Dyadobacter sp. CECT 9623]